MGVEFWAGTGDPASCGPARAGRVRRPGSLSALRLRSGAEVPGPPPRPTPGSRGRPESFPTFLASVTAWPRASTFPVGTSRVSPLKASYYTKRQMYLCVESYIYLFLFETGCHYVALTALEIAV